VNGGWTRPVLATTAAIVLAVAMGACGVPGSSGFEQINPPPELATTTTAAATTTASTRPPSSSTVAPSTTAATTTSTTEAPTTSTNPVFSASLYFVTGSGELTPIIRQLASSAAQQVLTELADGVPTGDEYGGLTTAIPSGTALVVTTASGLATVELPPTFLTATPPQNQTTAVAQIVLTLTARPGIGQVRFTSGGEPQEVSRPDSSLTNPGEVVACEDYSSMLAPGAAACG
jgi:spore germination protein GerM